MKKIFCIGEALIDLFGQTGQGLAKSTQFAKFMGGAAANTAAQVAKLGGSAYFMGQIGADSFGEYIVNIMRELGVNTSLSTQEGKSTLAFVALDRFGERDFEFYRGSDGEYQLVDLDLSTLKADDIVHFGSATALLGGKLKTSYFQLLELAEANNNLISFDPNYRENLITPEILPNYLHDCKTFISYADVVKLSEVEAQLISGEDNLTKAAAYLKYLGAKTIIITQGANGSLLCDLAGVRQITTRKIQQVDSTGAGDAFIGAILFKLAQHPEPNWDAFVGFANLIGAYTCTNYGAIKAMPTMRQFLEFIS